MNDWQLQMRIAPQLQQTLQNTLNNIFINKKEVDLRKIKIYILLNRVCYVILSVGLRAAVLYSA